jgi:4-hydroxythreonine-4-phosphate dehydrogenase
MSVQRLVLTSGEPAGIGPDLCLAVAGRGWPYQLVVAGDARLLQERAQALGLQVVLEPHEPGSPPAPHRPGRLPVLAQSLAVRARPGHLNPANARYVLGMLDSAVAGCLRGEFAAMVTAPVHKGVINDAGVPFRGHTEYLAARLGGARPVMLLVAGTLRVALATTHLPLADVPAAITRERLLETLTVLHLGLREQFRLDAPRIAVCGLNPHAGESGHLGREEIDVIAPAVADAVGRGINATGPVPADSAFTPAALARADAVLAMYHDQGLTVLKHMGFGRAVNVTLGLPIVRTSVDHGTAIALAGTGRAETGSLEAAIGLAAALSSR